MGRDIAAFLSGLIIIAIIFTLVRPGSQGPSFVKALGAAISNMLTAATGGAPQAAGGGTQTAGSTSSTPGTTTGAGAATAGAGSTNAV